MRLAPDNPMGRVMLAILCFEAVVCGLAIPGMIMVSAVPVGTAFGIGMGALLLAVVSAGMLRRQGGYPLAWFTQLVVLGLGLATPMMFAVGGMFVLLWGTCFGLGRKLEKQAATRAADQDG